MPLTRKPERSLIYKRLDDALSFLKANAPGRYERVRCTLGGFLIMGIDPIHASYDPATGVCRLRERYMLASDTTLAAIACTIVHEATHGRLFKLGIPYDEPIRHRIEQVCIRASLLTAQRLPGTEAEAEAERCRRQLSAISPISYSAASFDERIANDMRANRMPEWFIRMILKIRRRKRAGRSME